VALRRTDDGRIEAVLAKTLEACHGTGPIGVRAAWPRRVGCWRRASRGTSAPLACGRIGWRRSSLPPIPSSWPSCATCRSLRLTSAPPERAAALRVDENSQI